MPHPVARRILAAAVNLTQKPLKKKEAAPVATEPAKPPKSTKAKRAAKKA